MQLAITHVDVFSDVPFRGNPVAVVHDADHLTEAQMQELARWLNLSETTFVLQPTEPGRTTAFASSLQGRNSPLPGIRR